MKDTIAKATHEGKVKIGEFELRVYNLDNGERVMSRIDFLKALGRRGKAKGGRKYDEEFNLPVFLTARNLKEFIDKELEENSYPIHFIDLKRQESIGYKAQLLPSTCYVFMDASKANALHKNQLHILERSEKLVRGFATVGIIALIDEATGYQDIRVQKALEKILNEFLLNEKKPYIGMFPLEFYKQIYKLNNWQWMPENARKRPGVIGKWTNDVIYNRIAPKLLSELQKRNPTVKPGRRKFKHFQLLTDKVGDPALKSHFDGIMALMRATPNWRKFKELLNRAYPKYGDTIPIDFGLEE